MASVLTGGALAFLVIFHARLRQVPPDAYEARDDAVITLSHARNLIEYGFIGTSPSGERIEGFSAPLQFALATATYAVAPFEYRTFFRWQTFFGTLALGATFAGFLWSAAGPHRSWERGALIVVAVLAGAQILGSSTSFLWWHVSGMENVYKCLGLIAVLWSLDSMLRRRRLSSWFVVLLPLAAMTRIDAIVPAGILLAAFTLILLFRSRDLRVLALVAAALLPWMLLMAWRWQYFGQWEPNTGLAQGISVGRRVNVALMYPADALTQYAARFGNIGRSLFTFQLLWLVPFGILLRRTNVAIDRIVLIAAAVLACVAQYGLFGPSRMDLSRTVTELALYATLAVPFVLLGAETFDRRHLLAGVAVMALSVIVTAGAPPHQREIGWGTKGFEAVADVFADISTREDIPRPAVANSDLGAVSWRKQFNVIDLGRLGSAAIPRLSAAGAYVAAIVQPDMIELHAPWSCQYPDLFAAVEFRQEYVRVTPPLDPSQCPGPTGVLPSFWVRRAVMKGSLSSERRFLDDFRRTLSPELVDAELTRCLALGSERPCGYVGRTLFRFRPELRRAGHDRAIAELLRRDRRLQLEYAFFTSADDPRWWRAVAPQS